MGSASNFVPFKHFLKQDTRPQSFLKPFLVKPLYSDYFYFVIPFISCEISGAIPSHNFLYRCGCPDQPQDLHFANSFFPSPV